LKIKNLKLTRKRIKEEIVQDFAIKANVSKLMTAFTKAYTLFEKDVELCIMETGNDRGMKQTGRNLWMVVVIQWFLHKHRS